MDSIATKEVNVRLNFCFVIGGMVLLLANCTSVKPDSAPTAQSAPVVQPKPVAAPDTATQKVTKCNLGSEVRVIEIEDLSPVGCKVWYTRAGARGEIASSRIGRQHCEQVSIKIQTNLEAGGYKCTFGSEGHS